MPARALLRRGAVVLAGVLLLAGCAEENPSAGQTAEVPPPILTPTLPTDEPQRTPSPTPSAATHTPEPSASRESLADLAEQAASDDPSRSGGPARPGPLLGADVSWPQCPKGMGIPHKRSLGLPMPTPAAEYVVVGLTNGPGFTRNPCLADQVAWVRDRALPVAAYAVASWPSDAQVAEHGDDGPFHDGDRAALRNTGYQQALANVATLADVGLRTPIVWIDVEPVPFYDWSGDADANAAVVRGVVRGYADRGYRVGVYSTPYLWSSIVGDLRLGVPEWRAAGQTSRAEARSRCGSDWVIQGGEAVLGQWIEESRDHDITCPGAAAELGRWFHLP